MKNFNFQKSLCVSSLHRKKLFPALYGKYGQKYAGFFSLTSFRNAYTVQFHIAYITLTKYYSPFHKVYKYYACPSNMSICVITCQSYFHKICTMLYQKSISCISIFCLYFQPPYRVWRDNRHVI